MSLVSRIFLVAAFAGAPFAFLNAHSVEPLPSVDFVLKRVVERSENEEANERSFKQSYTYTRTKITEHRNADGALRKREAKTSEHVPKPAPAQPPPERPTPAEVRLQSPKEAGGHESNARGKAFDRKDFALDDELLSRFQFTLVGRETINGRPVLALDLKPASRNLPERSIKDRFINRAAGRVWIDEAEFALVKARLFLTERVNVVGGLVGAVWGFNYALNRERTDDGLWFTRDVDWTLEGRQVMSQRKVEYREQITGVRKTE